MIQDMSGGIQTHSRGRIVLAKEMLIRQHGLMFKQSLDGFDVQLVVGTLTVQAHHHHVELTLLYACLCQHVVQLLLELFHRRTVTDTDTGQLCKMVCLRIGG